jgi:ketosteroid isomerase-like protein
MAMTTREVFEKGTNAFNAHDLPAFAAVLAEDVAFKAPGGVAGTGKAACLDAYGTWLTAFSDGRVEVVASHILDDIVVEEGRFTGTHDGVLRLPTGDIPPTGATVRAEYVHVLRVRDGKHVSFNLLFDRLQLLEQLGLVPAPSEGAVPDRS